MLYSLTKKVTWSLVDGSLLSYTRKTKHESCSSWVLRDHTYHIKIVSHVMAVKGQILSLQSQAHVPLLNRDPGHHGQVHSPLPEGNDPLLGGKAPFFTTGWKCLSAEQTLVSVTCSFPWVLLTLDTLSPSFPMEIVNPSVDLFIVWVYKTVLKKYCV